MSFCFTRKCSIFDDTSLCSTSCLDAISSITSVCGGFIPLTIRETIESIAMSCITRLSQNKNIPLWLSIASTKVAVMRLALNCASSPWSDGCSSSLIGLLHAVASNLRYDREETVSFTAYMALSVCNTLMVPRAPPLVLATRHLSRDVDPKYVVPKSGGIDSSAAVVSYESLISGIMEKTKQDFKINNEGYAHKDTLLSSHAVLDTQTDVSLVSNADEKMGNLGHRPSGIVTALNSNRNHGIKMDNFAEDELVQGGNRDIVNDDPYQSSLNSALGDHAITKIIQKDGGDVMDWNKYKLKPEKSNNLDDERARPKCWEESGSFDNEELPDIIDGEPDEDMA